MLFGLYFKKFYVEKFELMLAGLKLTAYCNDINNRGGQLIRPSLAIHIKGGLLCGDNQNNYRAMLYCSLFRYLHFVYPIRFHIFYSAQ